MSQSSGAGISVSSSAGFRSASGNSADSFGGGTLDAVSCSGDMSNLLLPVAPRGRAESFVSLAPSIVSTELPKVNNNSKATATPSSSSSGYHSRSKSADIPKLDSFQLGSSVTTSNLGSITEMKNDTPESKVDGAKFSVGSLGSRKGDQESSITGDENMLPSNRSSTNTDTSFESSSTSPPSGGGNVPESSNPDSGAGGPVSVSNDTPMSKKSRRRTQPEGPSVLLNSVSSTGGGHNRKASSNILSNIFSTSYNKVLEDFRKLFPPDDYNGNQGLLLTHYSCALQTDPGLLEQGRLFVTSQGIYFTSFLRLKLRIFINFSEVEFLKKHQVMVVFPTAILICKKDGTNTVFASFRARDKSLALINHYFQCFQKDPMFFHNNRELFLKELTRNYGAKFVPPAHSDEEVTEESENSSEKDCGSESNKDENPAADGGSKLQIPATMYSMDDGKSTNSSTNENAVEHEIIKVPRDKKRETSQDRNSRTLTRDKDDSLMKDPAISVPGFYDNDADFGNEDEDEENETHITSSEPEVECNCEVHDTKSGWTQYLDNVYYISVDSAFNMLFEKSDFYYDVLKRRQATKFVCGKWRKMQGKAGQRERQLTYVMPTNSSVPVAPKVVDVTEMQYVDANECESKKIYTAKTRIKNHGKFSDSFVIHIKYCLTKNSRQRFRFQMSTKLEFVSSWVLMKDLIREQVDEGLKSHCDALDKALQLKISESKMGANVGAAGGRQPLANQTYLYNNLPSSGGATGAGGPSPMQTAGAVGAGGVTDYSAFNNNAADQYKTGANGPGYYDGIGEERRDRSVSIHQAPIFTSQQSRPGTLESGNLNFSRQGSLEIPPGSTLYQSTPSLSRFRSITYQLQNSTLLKSLAILLFFLACVSHSLLIYQLSTISPLLTTFTTTHHPNVISPHPSMAPPPPVMDPSAATASLSSASSSPSRVSSLDGLPLKQPADSPAVDDVWSDKSDRITQLDASSWADSTTKSEADFDKDVNGNQLFKMLLTSHLQQQNQFQLILKNSLNLLEVMTSNVNNMQVLVTSQITQHEAIMKQFMGSSKETSKEESSCSQSPNSATSCQQPGDPKEQKVTQGEPDQSLAEEFQKGQKDDGDTRKPDQEVTKLKAQKV